VTSAGAGRACGAESVSGTAVGAASARFGGSVCGALPVSDSLTRTACVASAVSSRGALATAASAWRCGRGRNAGGGDFAAGFGFSAGGGRAPGAAVAVEATIQRTVLTGALGAAAAAGDGDGVGAACVVSRTSGAPSAAGVPVGKASTSGVQPPSSSRCSPSTAVPSRARVVQRGVAVARGGCGLTGCQVRGGCPRSALSWRAQRNKALAGAPSHRVSSVATEPSTTTPSASRPCAS